MSIADLVARWTARRDEFGRLRVHVDGVAIADEVLADLRALDQAATVEPVTLREAARIGGYSIDHLQRMVAAGQLENVGRKHRPRVRRSDVPMKPGRRILPAGEVTRLFPPRRRIAASVSTAQREAK